MHENIKNSFDANGFPQISIIGIYPKINISDFQVIISKTLANLELGERSISTFLVLVPEMRQKTYFVCLVSFF